MFYVFDIDKDPHDLLLDYLDGGRTDVVFLLSVCMWVEKWRDPITFCAGIAARMVFESNGTEAQQAEQIEHLRKTFRDVSLVSGESQDDPGQKKRKLLLAQN